MFSYIEAAKNLQHHASGTWETKLDICRHLIEHQSCLTPHPISLVINHAISTLSGPLDASKVPNATDLTDETIASYWTVVNAALKSTPKSLLPTIPSRFFLAAASCAHVNAFDLDVIIQNNNKSQNKKSISNHAALVDTVALASSNQPSLQPLAAEFLHELVRLLSRLRNPIQAQAIALEVLPSLLQSPLPPSYPDLLRPFLLHHQSQLLRDFQPFAILLPSPNLHLCIRFIFSRFPHHQTPDMVDLFRFFIRAFNTVISDLKSSPPPSFSRYVAAITVLFDTVKSHNWYHPSRDNPPEDHFNKKRKTSNLPTSKSSSRKKQKTSNATPPEKIPQLVRSLFVSLIDLLSVLKEDHPSNISIISQISTAIASIVHFSVDIVDRHIPALFKELTSSVFVRRKEHEQYESTRGIRLTIFKELVTSYAKERSLPLLLCHVAKPHPNAPVLSAFADVFGAPSISLLLGQSIAQMHPGGAMRCLQSLLPATSRVERSNLVPLSFLIALVLESTTERNMNTMVLYVMEHFIPLFLHAKPCVEARAGTLFLSASLIFTLMTQDDINWHSETLSSLRQSGALGMMVSATSSQQQLMAIEAEGIETGVEKFVAIVSSTVSSLSKLAVELDARVCVGAIRLLSAFIRYIFHFSSLESSGFREQVPLLLQKISDHYDSLLAAVSDESADECPLFWESSPVDTTVTMISSLVDAVDPMMMTDSFSHTMVLVLEHWIDNYENNKTIWEDLFERKCVQSAIGKAVRIKVKKHIQGAKIGAPIVTCNQRTCSVVSALKLIQIIPTGYLGKANEASLQKSVVSLSKSFCCTKARAELLMTVRKRKGFCTDALEGLVEVGGGNCLLMISTNPGEGSMKLVKKLIKQWSREWECLGKAEAVLSNIVKAMDSESKSEKLDVAVLKTVIEFLVSRLLNLEKWCLRTLQEGKGDEEKQKCMLRTIAFVMAVERGLRNQVWAHAQRMQICKFVDKLINDAALFSLKKVVAGKMLVECGQFLNGLCGYCCWVEKGDEQIQERWRILSKVIGWMTHFIEFDCENVQNVGIGIAQQLADVANEEVVKVMAHHVFGWNENSAGPERKGKMNLSRCIIEGKAVQAHENVAIEIVHGMLTMSYMWLKSDLKWQKRSNSNDKEKKLNAGLEICSISTKSCETLLRRNSRRLHDEHELELVVMGLGRLLYTVSIHSSQCRDQDYIRILTGAANSCIVLLQQGGLSVKWACVKLGCSIVTFGSTFGGKECGEVVARVLSCIGWACQTQRLEMEAGRTLVMACAIAVVESGCADFETKVVDAMASVIYNSSMKDRTLNALLSHASPPVAIVLRKSKQLSNLMAYSGK